MTDKLYTKLLIIDGSYMLHRNLHVANLWELTNGVQRTGGVFGFLRSLSSVIKSAPAGYYPVVCWDKGLSNDRLKIHPNYKWQLDRTFEDKLLKDAKVALDEGKLPEAQDAYIELIKSKMEELRNMEGMIQAAPEDDYLYQYRSQRTDIIELLSYLGVVSILVEGWEGDDLMTLLTRLSEKSIIVTDDSDLQQLITEDIQVMKVLKGTSFVTLENILDDDLNDARDIAKIKAITGDSSDNVPQLVKGVGYVTAKSIVKVIDEYNDDPTRYLEALKARFANKSGIMKFIDTHDKYLDNLKLVDLSYVPNDESVISFMINELSGDLRVNYLAALSRLGTLGITQVPLDEIISYSVSSREGLTCR